MTNKQITFDEFLPKIETLKKSGGVDLSIGEDLSLAVMNLISLEEHFFFTAMKTGKDNYLDTSAEIREMRKELLAELMGKNEGETWCISKHLLSSTMRLIEVGNKLRSEKQEEKALKMFKSAYRIYSIFWALKLKLISATSVKNETAKNQNQLEELVTKLADCCNE